jgi:selenide,water dikinase
MITPAYSICIEAKKVLYIPEAERLAAEYLITGGGANNRKYLEGKVRLQGLSMPVEEILFDPQTSGGLLISVHKDDAEALLAELGALDPPCCMVGEVIQRADVNVLVN